MEKVNSSYYTTEEGGLSDVWRVQRENQCAYWQRKKENIEKNQPIGSHHKMTSTLSYTRIILLFLFYCLFSSAPDVYVKKGVSTEPIALQSRFPHEPTDVTFYFSSFTMSSELSLIKCTQSLGENILCQ